MSQLSITLRPRSFDEVIGHADIVKALRSKLDAGDVPRAILFHGPAGVGKTTLAKIVAREAQGWDFPADSEPDVLEINAAKVGRVDDARELAELSATFPMVGKYRVIILDEAQQLTKEAQNCLLKPFEDEKAVATVWIICTTDPEKIIKALISRCLVYQLSGLSQVERSVLLTRAAAAIGRTESYSDFEKEATKCGLLSPRSLLTAFENYCGGIAAEKAVGDVLFSFAPEFQNIAWAVAYGFWNKPCKRGKETVPSVQEQLVSFDAYLTKKNKQKGKVDESEEMFDFAGEDVASRPEAARGLRAIIAAYLKTRVLKGHAPSAEALMFISRCAPPSAFDTALEYPATLAGIFRAVQAKEEMEKK